MSFLPTNINDFFLDISRGTLDGYSFIHKFGQAPDFDTADNEIHIWDGADDAGINQMTYTFATGATIDSISSADDTDVVDIEVQGLDSAYTLTVQTITLSGQTRVALDTNLTRVFRMKNVGSADLSGDTYCYENTALTDGVPDDKTKIKAVIQNGNNQTLMCIYTIPAGKTGYLYEWDASTAGASKSSQYIIRVKARPFGQVFQLKHISSISDTAGNTYTHEYKPPTVYSEKTDFVITVQATEAGATGASVAASFDLILIDN